MLVSDFLQVLQSLANHVVYGQVICLEDLAMTLKQVRPLVELVVVEGKPDVSVDALP